MLLIEQSAVPVMVVTISLPHHVQRLDRAKVASVSGSLLTVFNLMTFLNVDAHI